MIKKQQKVLVIVGATASGKTALGVELARTFDGEVISADSRQVYRGLDIGTGKVTKREMKGVPHHLLDVCSPKKTFTAHDFLIHARRAIADIARRGKLPIIVGGTGFYIDATLGRVSLADAPVDAAWRSSAAGMKADTLYALLRDADPERAAAMDTPSERNNRTRLVRALEIARALGASPAQRKNEECDTFWIGIRWPRDVLATRIETRLDQRLRRGLIAEARRLHAAGLSYRRMEALGLEYGALARFLRGDRTRERMRAELLTDIIKYAKRQETYWRRNPATRWFDPARTDAIKDVVAAWLSSA